MKDRIPLYPGRVTLTPVSGQTNTYDMVRADSPTEVGTALNKANLLSDETATALGLTQSDPVPDDAFTKITTSFEALSASLSALSTSATKVATGSYIGTGTWNVGNEVQITFDFEPKLVLVTRERAGYGTFQSGNLGYSWDQCLVWFPGVERAYQKSGNTIGCTYISVSSNTFVLHSESWMDTAGDAGLNVNGVTYRYVGIG